MKAQILYGIGNIKYTETDAPVPKKSEALVRVRCCGICGSDIPRIYKTGAHNMPLIPGHEFSGVIEECTDEPELIGKRTAVFPLIPCMECEQCRAGRYEMCSNYNYLGSRSDGAYAEYVSVPIWNLLPLPDELTDEEAAMLEPMCVAVHAMRRIGLLQAQGNIVVCGLGTIGLLLAMFLKDAGYENVLFIGNKDIQKRKLLDMGFDKEQICDVRYGDPHDFIMGKTGGRGADYYFECIGRSESYAQAVNCMAPLGKIMLVGNPASGMELPREIYWKILRNQLTMKGTWNSSFSGFDRSKDTAGEDIGSGTQRNFADSDDWSYALQRLVAWHDPNSSGAPGKFIEDDDGIRVFQKFLPHMLITHRFDIEHMQDGLRIMQRKSEEYIKIMVGF